MATRTVRHAGAVWSISRRESGEEREAAPGIPAPPMTLVVIESSAGHRAVQALPAGALEAMSDEALVEVVEGVLRARERE
jgi:hypothetical protein